MLEKGTRARAILGSFVFFLVAPGLVAGLVPFALVGWTPQSPLLGLPGERLVGVAAVGAGLACLLDCFARFALEGRGTPAPVEQTEVLVASGLYRFVRNPMYVCVVTIVLGQALLLGQAPLLAYAAVVLVAFHLFVRLYEEPTTLEDIIGGQAPAGFAITDLIESCRTDARAPGINRLCPTYFATLAVKV